jgi:hypothetical protein
VLRGVRLSCLCVPLTAGRRELGHGELAQRALAPAVPPRVRAGCLATAGERLCTHLSLLSPPAPPSPPVCACVLCCVPRHTG